MSKKVRTISLALVMLMVIGISGCASKEAPASTTTAQATVQANNTAANTTAANTTAAEHEKVTLSILHEHSEEAAQNIPSSAGFRAMLDKYKAEHPWVTLDETMISNAEIGKKYLTLIAADDLPDVTYVKYPWLESMAGNNMLADLTEYVNPDDYVDKCFAVTYNGKIYGMENKYSIYNLVLYNEKMWKDAGFEKFPSTMDEMITAAKFFKDQGKSAMSVGNTGKWFAVSYFASPLMYNYCGKEWVESMLACENKYKWTDDCFVNAMTKLQEMSPLFNSDANMQDDIWAAGWYMQGNAASHAVGSWGINTCQNMKDKYPEVWENTRVAIMPSANNADSTIISACGGASVGVNSKLKGAAHDAAVQLCQQISSKDYAQFMADRGTIAPVKIKVDFKGKGVPFEDFADILNNTANNGLNFNDYFSQNLATVLQEEVQSLMAGTTTPKDVAAKMQATQDGL